MRRAALASAMVLAIGGATVAVAQPSLLPGTAEEASEQGMAYGDCVSEAAKEGAEDAREACAELRPGSERAGGDGDEPGGDEPAGRRDETPAAQCADENKRDGSFGKCVAAIASSFGKCVAENAASGMSNPTEACAELRRGGASEGGAPEEIGTGRPEGTPSGPPQGVPSGKPEGTPSGPPEGVPTGKP